MSTHVTRRLGVKRSIENAIFLFRPGTSPQDGATPDENWPPPESIDVPPDSSRHPSLSQSDEPRPSYGRPSRPSSAGNGAERPHHHHSRRLGSKYSLLNLFRKSSTEMLSTHSTPGGATPDVNIGTDTSNTTSSPTSPLSSSPSTIALELSGLGQDGSPARSSMLRSNGVSSASSSGAQSVSISASQHPQTSRSLRFNSSEPNVSSRGKSPRRTPLGSSPGHDGRLSEESEDEDEDEEYGIEAVRSRIMAGDASTQDIGFPFSIDVPVEDESPGLSDIRGRGDSLSTNLSATTASTASLSTPSAPHTILPTATGDVKISHGHRPPPLTGLAASNVSTHAEAEALVAHARGQVLTAREGDDIPLSARLAALGESLRLERKFKEAKESVIPGSPIERRASEGTALDVADAEPWEQHLASGKTRSASASAGVGAPFVRQPMSGMGLVGGERNFSLDYRVGHSWRGRSRRLITNESALSSSDDGMSAYSTSVLTMCAHADRRPPRSSTRA
jgi:hypothetical protein